MSISGSSSIGSTTTLSLTCCTSGIVDRYNWYHNSTYSPFNTSYSSRTTNSYVKSPAQLTDSGDYYCEACDLDWCTISHHRVEVTGLPTLMVAYICDFVVHTCVHGYIYMFLVLRWKFNMYHLYLAYIGVLHHTYRQDIANVLPGVDNLYHVEIL